MNRVNTPKILTRSQLMLVAMVAVAILAALASQYLLSAMVLLVLTTLSLPKNISLLVRAFSAYSFFFVANIIAVLIISFVEASYNLSVLLPIYSLIAGAYAWYRKDGLSIGKPVLLRSDALILVLGLVVFSLSITPLTHSENRRIETLASGEDNASHYALTNTIASNRSYTYFIAPEKAGVFIALRNYPQGMHVNFAINSQIVAGKHEVPQTYLLESYAVQISAYLGLLFIVILLCARRLGLSLVDEGLFVKVTAAVSPILVCFVGLGTSKYLFSYGFHSQIVAYIFVLLGLLWLMSRTATVWTKSIEAALCGIAIAFTWFFLVPVYAAFVLVWVAFNWRSLKPQLSTLRYVLLILITVILIAIPFLIQQKGGDGTSVDTPGGVHILTRVTMFFFGGISVLYLFTRRTKQLIDGSPTSLVFALAVMCLLFSAVIGIYQLATIHTFAYYFYKSLYILPLIASVFGLGLILLAVKAIIKEEVFKVHALIIGLSIFLGSSYLLFAEQQPSTSMLSQKVNSKLIAHVMDEAGYVKTPQHAYDVVITKSCTPAESYLTQRWIGATLLNDQTLEKARVYHAQLDQVPISEIVTTYRQGVDKVVLIYDNTACDAKIDTSESKELRAVPVSDLLAN